MPLGVLNDGLASELKLDIANSAGHGSDALSGSALTASHSARHMAQPLVLSTSSGMCRVHWRSSSSLRPTCFLDIQPSKGANPHFDDDKSKEEWFVEPAPNWLGILEDSEYLKSTTLLSKDWIAGSDFSDPIDKSVLPWRCPKHPKETKYRSWWHPEFVFKNEVHAVRIRLKSLYPKERMMWDVIFAGRPGNPWTVPVDAPPAGGFLPVFEMFCPPMSAKSKFELRLTEAESEKWDETLTLLPSAQCKWKRAIGKPRLHMWTQEEATGPIKFDEEQTSLGEGVKDEQGNVQYMAMPISPVLITLASFL
mmetsp:Transcript_18324/g.33433  ORF Transcript_18324/g.33433 Transcript_18324/m.33433 type:complete len:308 (+) Transcript_18324:119-1042(+)